MRDFAADSVGAAELAYVLLGSVYVASNREFLGHLDRVATVLPSGGLYLLDSVVWFELFSHYRRRWTRRRRGRPSARATGPNFSTRSRRPIMSS